MTTDAPARMLGGIYGGGTAADHLPTDAQVWDARSRSWAEWAHLTGVSATTIAREMTARGWRRDSAGGQSALVEAPCQECGKPFPATHATRFRVCPACLEPDALHERLERGEALTVAEERKLYMARLNTMDLREAGSG